MLKISSFINKIKEIFIGFFKNKNSLMLSDGIEDNEIEIIEDEYIDDNLISSFSSEQQKKDFLITYNNVKKGIIKLDELLFSDAIKVRLMMQEEIGILDNKIKSTKNEIENLNFQKNMLTKEKQYYYEKYKNKV